MKSWTGILHASAIIIFINSPILDGYCCPNEKISGETKSMYICNIPWKYLVNLQTQSRKNLTFSKATEKTKFEQMYGIIKTRWDGQVLVFNLHRYRRRVFVVQMFTKQNIIQELLILQRRTTTTNYELFPDQEFMPHKVNIKWSYLFQTCYYYYALIQVHCTTTY